MSRIGERLAAARRAKGLSLTDVERAIKVRTKYLEALETEDHAALPEEAYTRAFLKSYAEFLGLDARDLLRQHRVERGSPTTPSLPEPVEGLDRDHAHVPPRVWLAVAAGVLVALVVWVGFGLASATRAPNPADGPARRDAERSEETRTAKPAGARPVPEGNTEVVVAPSSQAFPYVEISVNGRKAWEGLLSRSRRFVGKKVHVRASDGRQITITWDGKRVNIPVEESGLYEQVFIAR